MCPHCQCRLPSLIFFGDYPSRLIPQFENCSRKNLSLESTYLQLQMCSLQRQLCLSGYKNRKGVCGNKTVLLFCSCRTLCKICSCTSSFVAPFCKFCNILICENVNHVCYRARLSLCLENRFRFQVAAANCKVAECILAQSCCQLQTGAWQSCKTLQLQPFSCGGDLQHWANALLM